ncbi:uncharacterized protein [Haliotis asinina]|uniref:uncharacterized protein isoform X2 n=1 Tax=Haliotis asinina TaxID=109174 RepID=UPI003531BAC1
MQAGPHMLVAPRPPSKPITSYLRFSKKIWEKVKVDRPNAPVWETSQIIGQMWRGLSDEEKRVYVAEYEADREEYKKAFEAYRVALADYQEAVGAAQQIAENNRLLLEAEQAAHLYVHQVPFLNMPVRMKPEPVDPNPPQIPYVQQLEHVLTSPPMLRPPGPGPLYVPHNVQVLNYNPEPPPQPQPQAPQAPPAQQAQQSSALEKDQSQQPSSLEPSDKNEDDNIEDRIDVDSIKGIFGWATIDTVNVPYIVRKHKKYVAVRIVEKKLLSRYPNSFPDELGKKEPLVSYFVTENEAKLLDEINQVHCSCEYGQQAFTCKDLIVDMAEFEDFYNLVKKTFPDDYLAKLRGEIPQQQVQQPVENEGKPVEHVKSELAKVCGWVQINNTVSPYIRRYSGKFVPLSVIKYAAGLLTELQIEGTLPTLAECNLLNETCKAAGFDFTFGQNTKVIHLSEVTQRCQVSILELPFDDPLKHAQYIDLPSPTKAQQAAPNQAPIGPRPPGSVQSPNVNPFAGYPSAPPNPFFNMMPMMPQRYPQQPMGQYPLPPQGQRFPFMPPQNMPNPRSNMGSPPRQSLPSPGQMPSQHGQFQPSGRPSPSHPQSSPLSMMSHMAQNGQMHPMQGAFPGQMHPGNIGPMNPMIRPSQTTPISQGPGMSPLGLGQGMRMPMTAPTEMMPRGPMLHTAQMPQLSPSQSAISRFPNPHSMLPSQQMNNQNGKLASTPNSTYAATSPAASSISSSPKTVPNSAPAPASIPAMNGDAPQRPPSNQSSGQSRSSSRSSLVDKISGVVLNGKSISCMHLDHAEKPGKFCLVEAVCKLYFSQSSMNEFLYALQNVLKIPLHSCNEDEEKAFIQYYNLPVSVLKCNKMISLTDLEKYFPQMSYMFSQCDTPTEGSEDQNGTAGDKPTTDSPVLASDTTLSAPPAESPADASQSSTSRKRPSLTSLSSAPPPKQPCRRLEEMVQRLKQSQNANDGCEKPTEEQQEEDQKPVTLPPPTVAANEGETGRKEEVIVLD